MIALQRAGKHGIKVNVKNRAKANADADGPVVTHMLQALGVYIYIYITNVACADEVLLAKTSSAFMSQRDL